MRSRGFTLVELMVALSVVSVLGLLGFVAVSVSAQSAALARAQAEVQDDVRNVVGGIARELQSASPAVNAALTPPLGGVAVVAHPAPASPVELVFQVPLDGTGRRWSQPIRFRFENEDVNGDSRPDPGREDTNGDGVVARRVVRLQDLDGDGAWNGPDEQVVVGGANTLSAVQFAVQGRVVTVTVTATRLVAGHRGQLATATLRSEVYLYN